MLVQLLLLLLALQIGAILSILFTVPELSSEFFVGSFMIAVNFLETPLSILSVVVKEISSPFNSYFLPDTISFVVVELQVEYSLSQL